MEVEERLPGAKGRETLRDRVRRPSVFDKARPGFSQYLKEKRKNKKVK